MRIMRTWKIAGLSVLVFGVLAIAFLFGGRLVELRDIRKDYVSQSRFAQIRCMLLSYHEEHGAFPPTKYRAAPNGPVHSWRVLLIPNTDIEYRKLYSDYDFSENWNSPKNLRVIKAIRNYFSLDVNDTANYLAVSDGDQWPSEKPLKARLITKGKDRFLLVEYPDSKIRWMEPEY